MDSDVIRFLYKWHRLEKINRIDIIDFDLIQLGSKFPGRFTNRQEALEELRKLLLRAGDASLTLRTKLIAYEAYLRALMGEKIGFEEYVKSTMAIKPEMIPTKILDLQLNRVRELYGRLGYDYTVGGVKSFIASNLLQHEEITKTFDEFEHKLLPEFLGWLNLDINVDYLVEFVDEDAYWMNWISTNEKGAIVLKYNTNKHHKWVRGVTENLVIHEICGHALSYSSWKNRINANKMEMINGLTTVFSPEQFFFEGVAESLWCFYPDIPFSDFGLLALYNDHLYWLVMNNAHIMLNMGQDEETVTDFIRAYIPYHSYLDVSDDVALKQEFSKRTKNPLLRTYLYVYGIALYQFMQIADSMDAKTKKVFVRDIYTNAYYPKELVNKYMKLR